MNSWQKKRSKAQSQEATASNRRAEAEKLHRAKELVAEANRHPERLDEVIRQLVALKRPS